MIAPLLDMFTARAEEPTERIEPTIGIQNQDVDSNKVKLGDLEAFDLLGSYQTAAGVSVSSKTAMRVSAVYSCVSLIAGAVAMLSYPVYRRTDASGREKTTHDYWWFFNEQACPEFTSSAFWELIVSQMLLRGDGLAYLDRDRGGNVRNVIPIPRSQWTVKRREAPEPGMAGRLVYAIQFDEGFRGVPQDDVLHFPGFGFNGLHGMSAIQWGARAGIGIALRGDEWAGKFFGKGAQPAHAVKAPGEMTPDQQDGFREAWDRAYSGQGPTGRPLILTEGLDIKELSMTAKDAQMLEARQWQVIDIARAFRVPPHMIGETTQATSWGSGIEQMGIGFDVYTMGPHLARIRHELNRKLWPRSTGFFIEPDSRSLMRMDGKARSEYLSAALGGTQNPAWMTQNEARQVENLPPIDGGDALVRPQEPTQETEE